MCRSTGWSPFDVDVDDKRNTDFRGIDACAQSGNNAVKVTSQFHHWFHVGAESSEVISVFHMKAHSRIFRPHSWPVLGVFPGLTHPDTDVRSNVSCWIRNLSVYDDVWTSCPLQNRDCLTLTVPGIVLKRCLQFVSIGIVVIQKKSRLAHSWWLSSKNWFQYALKTQVLWELDKTPLIDKMQENNYIRTAYLRIHKRRLWPILHLPVYWQGSGHIYQDKDFRATHTLTHVRTEIEIREFEIQRRLQLQAKTTNWPWPLKENTAANYRSETTG